MCRIAGIISDKLTPRELLENTLTMCNALKHGGPDDAGTYHTSYTGNTNLALGHRRLAIIDLSVDGHQPMADEGERAWITFNGEIYNYQHLRQELINLGVIFNTLTDTEVIIKSYLKWGISAFSRLRGMFAFALYDVEQQVTYLVRDSAGIKPLYYHIKDKQLGFASEVQALKKAGIATDTDNDWPVRFLAYGHIPEPYTTLRDVFSLPKGNVLTWENKTGSFDITPYRTVEKSNQYAITDKSSAQKSIRGRLDKTISRQLLADAPIGVFLSGGLDSSLLTLLASLERKENLQTVSIFFEEKAYNERQYQQIVQQQSGINSNAHLVKAQNFYDSLPQILQDMDMPTTDGINSWFISKYARQDGLKAVLSGIGADELFGGYPSFSRIRYIKFLKLIPGPLLKLIALLSTGRLKRFELLAYNYSTADYLFLRGLFTPAVIAKLLNRDKKEVLNILFGPAVKLDNMTLAQKASWYETNLYMQNQLLRDTDVMSMAHGLEVRVPFLDEDFTGLLNQIKPDIRFDDKRPKNLLISTYKDFLPTEIWKRPKMGFSFPLQNWMAKHQQIADLHFYQNKPARRIIKRFKKSSEHWSKAFALYQLQKQGLITGTAQPKKVFLLTLETFCGTGGIQKMGRIMSSVLQQIAEKNNWQYRLWSVYDDNSHINSNYVHPANFKGFNKKRAAFTFKTLLQRKKPDLLILTHINLALIGCLSKIINPRGKIWLIAHGIEVWRPLGFIKKLLLKKCDKVICVSNFTRQKLIDLHYADPAKCVVINNALDPLINMPEAFTKPEALLKKHNLSSQNKVIFTLTRLASTEQYKGYEQVIKAVSNLKKQMPEIKYILAGQYDDAEYQRINKIITEYSVQNEVILTGYVAEDKLEDYFLLADLFVLPSKKEGFGMVFIEAMAHGLPVICGNEDGSLDAIKNGELGQAVNTDNLPELENAIFNALNAPPDTDYRRKLQEKSVAYFGTATYSLALEKLLADEPN